MAWSGYLTFAGVEIANVARTQRYMRDAAPGYLRACDCSCGELHEVVGDRPYSNPAMDDAPWYDPDVAESTEFCGFYPLSITGLDDSTRTATVIESIGHGGVVTGKRLATREPRVRGMLLASSDRGLQYGQDWLNSVLDGSCGGCQGDSLCFFSSCPDPCVVPRRKVTNGVDPESLTGTGGNWDGQVWTPSSALGRLWTPRLTGPLPCAVSYEWRVQGPAGTVVWLRVGGEQDQADSSQRFVLNGDVQRLTLEDKGWSQRWVRSSLAVGEAPQPLVPSESLYPSEGLFPDAVLGETYQPPVTVHEVLVTHTIEHPDHFAAATTYLRQLRRVHALEGPRTIRERSDGPFHMREIDFTLVAKPHVFSQEIPIAALHSGRPTTTLSGRIDRVSLEIPDCPDAVGLNSVGPYGIVDPDMPRIPPPPILDPLILNSGRGRPEDRYVITIPDAALPTWTDMVPTIRLGTAQSPIRNVRIRFFPVTRLGMKHTDLDGCDVCGAFSINYIPPNSEMTLDGATQRATIRYNGTNQEHEANHLLSSDMGRVFTWPVLSCGVGYFAALDVDFVALPVLSLALVARR